MSGLLELSAANMDSVSEILEIVFMAVFAVLLIISIFSTFKYRLYKDGSSLFIMVSLMLLDLMRLSCCAIAYYFTAFFFGSELLIRLEHDIPSFLFDCVTIPLLFQFMTTYDVLTDT